MLGRPLFRRSSARSTLKANRASPLGDAPNAQEDVQNLASHGALDASDIGLGHLRRRYAGAGIPPQGHERLPNPAGGNRIHANGPGEVQCRRTHEAFDARVYHADRRTPTHRLPAQEPAAQSEGTSICEDINAEPDQVDLTHELAGETVRQLRIGEGEKRTKRSVARCADHGVNFAHARVKARDRVTIGHVDRECRARVTHRDYLVSRLKCLHDGGADRARRTDDQYPHVKPLLLRAAKRGPRLLPGFRPTDPS